MKHPMRPLLYVGLAAAFLTACQSNNPYDNSGPSNNRTATYGGLGALGGALGGAAIGHNHGKGALIGGALGALGGAAYGHYVDQQEAELRRQMQNTGVEVQRQGDNLKLIMPGNITFATDSAKIAESFHAPLDKLATSFQQYNQNNIEVVGYTDSTGSRQHNMDLSRRRAQSVADYLTTQGVEGSRLSTRGAGPDQPIASNATTDGRAQNRRVEVNLIPPANPQPQGAPNGQEPTQQTYQ